MDEYIELTRKNTKLDPVHLLYYIEKSDKKIMYYRTLDGLVRSYES